MNYNTYRIKQIHKRTRKGFTISTIYWNKESAEKEKDRLEKELTDYKFYIINEGTAETLATIVSRETFKIKPRRKEKMKQDTILDSHNKSKLDFYTFIWEYFGVSPTEYKTSKDKFKRTMMSEYENYLEEENY